MNQNKSLSHGPGTRWDGIVSYLPECGPFWQFTTTLSNKVGIALIGPVHRLLAFPSLILVLNILCPELQSIWWEPFSLCRLTAGKVIVGKQEGALRRRRQTSRGIQDKGVGPWHLLVRQGSDGGQLGEKVWGNHKRSLMTTGNTSILPTPWSFNQLVPGTGRISSISNVERSQASSLNTH